MTFDMKDYVDVAERIKLFREKYPEGTLQSIRDPYLVEAGGKVFMVYGAAAYRTPDDPRPGIGWAWEPVPGPTQFTRDSELQNAETAAWGRAIVALGFETKHIASRQEVESRKQARPRQETPNRTEPSTSTVVTGNGLTTKQATYAHTLATNYSKAVGGMEGVMRAMDNGALPGIVKKGLDVKDDGKLVWKMGKFTAQEASDFIDAMQRLVEAEATPA